MEQNLELQKKEYGGLITSNQQFLEVVSGKKIIDSTEEEIKQSLRYAMVKIGLRGDNFPTGVEKALLIQHVYSFFGDLVPKEINIAFDWAIDGRLNLQDNEINCFENFSCHYFSKIMKAYLKLKIKIK